MAEERLIDDDKDKKYRFRKNENGEEELIIDDGLTEDEQTEGEEAEFEVPDFEEDDEDAAVLTPEQLIERQRRAEREKQERERKLAESIAAAASDSAVGNFATALDALEVAEELDPENGEVHALKLLVYTRNCTEWEENAAEAAEAAQDVNEFTPAERRAQLLQLAESGGLPDKITALTQEVERLNAENEAKKAERAVRFNADNRKSLIFFACTGIPFITFLVLAICYSTVMYATQDGVNIILTIVFAALALLALIAFVFASRALSTTSRRVRLNRKNSSTELGRRYAAESARLDALTAIYAALKE